MLFLSSVASGLIGTTVMLIFLYLPTFWNGLYYDTLGGLGGIFTQKIDRRAQLIGAILLFTGGILFAFFYGFFVLMLTQGAFSAPDYTIFRRSAAPINLFFPLAGLVGGMGHGIFVSLITSFIVTDFHPIPEYRDAFTLILSFVIGHTVYGVTVMFFQAQFLQLLAR